MKLPLHKRVAFTVLLAGVCAGGLEMIARGVDAWTYVDVDELRETYTKRRNWRLGHEWPLQRGDYPYLPYVLNPADGQINSLGFKGPEIQRRKPEGTYRILCLGGSTTFNGYPAYLEDQLRDSFEEQGLRLEVINAGNQCYTTLDSLINLITRGLATSPDAVVVYHAVNDAIYSFARELSPDYSNLRIRFEKDDPLVWDRLPTVLDHSAAFVGFRAVFERNVGQRGIGIQVTRDVSSETDRRYQGMEPFRQNLRTLSAITAERDIALFLCTQVFNRHAEKKVSLFDQWGDAVDDANDITRSMGDPQRRVEVIDVAADLPGDNTWMTDFCHFTEDGKQTLAGYIARHIRPEIGSLVTRRAATWPLPAEATAAGPAPNPRLAGGTP